MKKILIILLLLPVIMIGCSKHSGIPRGYDAEECARLSTLIEHHDSITQRDYSSMIAQNEAILQYLIDRTKQIGELPDSCRYPAWRTLTAEPEYLERFGYMFTIGSALYQADINGRLDEDNRESYAALDDYNSKLADYTDRF